MNLQTNEEDQVWQSEVRNYDPGTSHHQTYTLCNTLLPTHAFFVKRLGEDRSQQILGSNAAANLTSNLALMASLQKIWQKYSECFHVSITVAKVPVLPGPGSVFESLHLPWLRGKDENGSFLFPRHIPSPSVYDLLRHWCSPSLWTADCLISRE